MEPVTDLISLGSKISMDGDCSNEIKRCLHLRRKAMTNLDSILKSRDITLPTKVHLAKAMVFPVVMYEYESWTLKKAEHWRTDAFELWSWRRLLRVPWTARRLNQTVLNIHWKVSCWSWSSNTLASWCELTVSLKRTLMLGKIEGRRKGDNREWDGWMASLTQWTWVWANLGAGDGRGSLVYCSPWGCKELDTTEWLNWTVFSLHIFLFNHFPLAIFN